MNSISASQPVRTWLRATAPGVHSVPLERLPATLQFPESLSDRIWFDSHHGCLAFRGFMSKAVYDQLDAISNDLAYQRALDELFQVSVYDETERQQRWLGKLLPLAALVTLALLALAALALPLRLLAMR